MRLTCHCVSLGKWISFLKRERGRKESAFSTFELPKGCFSTTYFLLEQTHNDLSIAFISFSDLTIGLIDLQNMNATLFGLCHILQQTRMNIDLRFFLKSGRLRKMKFIITSNFFVGYVVYTERHLENPYFFFWGGQQFHSVRNTTMWK